MTLVIIHKERWAHRLKDHLTRSFLELIRHVIFDFPRIDVSESVASEVTGFGKHESLELLSPHLNTPVCIEHPVELVTMAD